MIDSGANAKNITHIITVVSDTIVEKLINMAIKKIGPPPARFAFMALGSEGREEQTLVTDQDNALIYEDVPEDKGFYVGLGYSHLSHDIDFEGSGIHTELDFNGVMLDVGYKFNPYIAVEGRYNVSLGDELDDEGGDADISVLSSISSSRSIFATTLSVGMTFSASILAKRVSFSLINPAN